MQAHSTLLIIKPYWKNFIGFFFFLKLHFHFLGGNIALRSHYIFFTKWDNRALLHKYTIDKTVVKSKDSGKHV